MKRFLVALLFTCPVYAEQVNWQYVGVVDGDTIKFIAPEFPKPLQKMSIRVDGIDTPESTFRAKCEKEKELGLKAKSFVKDLAAVCPIKVRVRGWGKYGGRALGGIAFCDKDLKTTLLLMGFAKSYDGGKKSDWCN